MRRWLQAPQFEYAGGRHHEHHERRNRRRADIDELVEQRAGAAVAARAQTASSLGFPRLATRNTTRVAGTDAVADAAGVALAVFPSAAPGTHPTVVTLAPTDDWQAALASSVLMAPPIHAPVLLSGPGSQPAATADALKLLAPTGSGSLSGAQVVLRR